MISYIGSPPKMPRIRKERRMSTREEVKERLKGELDNIYCYNCRKGEDCEDDYCHRKYMGWQPSDGLLDSIIDICREERTADYDEKNDILFVHLSPDNSNSYGEEIDKNIIIMRDIDSDEITGVMLYGFNKYVKHGRWIDETFKPWGLVYHPYKCDQCGDHSEADFNFCPNCGARMDAERKES